MIKNQKHGPRIRILRDLRGFLSKYTIDSDQIDVKTILLIFHHVNHDSVRLLTILYLNKKEI